MATTITGGGSTERVGGGANSTTGAGSNGGNGGQVYANRFDGGAGGGAGVGAGGAGGLGAVDSSDPRKRGGDGGAGGVHGYFGATIPTSSAVTGTDGSRGGDAGLIGNGGGGGAGGYGAVVTGSGAFGTLSFNVTGGNGGQGGNTFNWSGGGGGRGGIGLWFDSLGAKSITIASGITGGSGGATGSHVEALPSTRAGAGGEGVWGSNLAITLVAGGAITGGMSGDNASRAAAVYFESGTNSFEFQGGTVNGNVVGNGTSDAFRLGGSSGGTFDVSKIGSSSQFRGFETLGSTGSAAWTLTGTNTSTQSWTASSGTLVVNATMADTAFTVANGATLGGSGTVGDVTVQAGGTLSAGNSPGILTTGDLTLTTGTTFTVEMQGTAAGVGGYDQVVVNGTVVLGGATLSLSLLNSFNPSVGATFTIIDNDGTSDAVTGTFAGLAENGLVISGSEGFRISYVGGDGNDVVLTNIAPEAQSLEVTTNIDVVNAFDGVTSLREAVAYANAHAGADTITFDKTVFTGGAASLIRLTNGEIEITGAVTIDGSTGTGLTITGDKNDDDITVSGTDITDVTASLSGDDRLDDNSRIFNITSSAADTTLKNLTLTGGRTTARDATGGAVESDAILTVEGVTFAGNSTAGVLADGGAVRASSFVAVNSTFSGNFTSGEMSGGGAVRANTLNLTNSSVVGNGTSGPIAYGGGLYFDTGTLFNSTITGNATTGRNSFGGGVFGLSSVTMQNSIIIGNASGGGNDVSAGRTTLNGRNIFGSTVVSEAGPSGTTSAAELFSQTATTAAGVVAGVLGNNGGLVQTVALLASANNPALDASIGSTSTAGANAVDATDQTGVGNEGTGPTVRDLGAYEAPDFIKPTVDIVVADTALLSGETSLVTFTFSEKVKNFENADLGIESGTLTNVQSSDGGKTWTATFTPNSNIEDTFSTITLDLSKLEDLAGNAGVGLHASNPYAIDTLRPTATVVVADTALSVGETSLVTIAFSEKVKNFENADLAIENGSLTNVQSSDGGKTWTATFTPAANIQDTSNVITLNLATVNDLAGNAGVGTQASNSYAIDNVRPTATVVVADSALSVGETSLVTFTFSEKVKNFSNADLTIENGSLTNVKSSDGGKTWTATFTPTANIQDTSNVLTLNLVTVNDLAGNAGVGTQTSNTYAIDNVRPTATVVVADTALNTGETSLATFTFSEKVKNFSNADLTIENGSLTNVKSSDGGKTWTATFTQAPGVVDPSNVITLNLAGVSDLAGNSGAGTIKSNTYALLDDAPTAVVASNIRSAIAETASTATAIKFADLAITDVDGGSNLLSLSGADASLFQILNGDLYLKAGALLDFETNPSLDVTVNARPSGGAISASKALKFAVTDMPEVVPGTAKDDNLVGNSWAETLDGAGGNDTINGGGGNDTIIGGTGRDILTGGEGRDTFVFGPLDSAPGVSGYINNGPLNQLSGATVRDIITDFTPGFDLIDLLAIDAQSAVAGDQAFAFKGAGSFSVAGDLIYRQYDNAGTADDRTIIYGDTNGDRAADFQIELTGLKTLSATDFRL